MIKIIDPAGFNFDQPIMSLVDVHRNGVDKSWLQKSAAVLTKEMSEIRPEKGRTFVHLIALGDLESYGLNRNGDGFPKQANVDYHKTFEKHANFYRHHKNKPHLGHKIYGNVKHAAYNPDMKRVELVINIEDKAAPDTIQKLASGKDIPVSMACVTDPEYPVRTKDGYKAIATIQVGDEVLTHSGNWKKVKQLNRRKYTGLVRKFSFNGLPLPLELTADHMMWAKCFVGSKEAAAVKTKASRYFRDGDAFEKEPAGWVHAEHIEVGDRMFYRPEGATTGVAGIDDINLAVLMGYYVAEGSLGYNKDKACTTVFTCNMADSLIQKVPSILSEMYPGLTCTIRPHTSSTAALNLEVYSTDFGEFMKKMHGAGVRNKRIPLEMFNARTQAKLAFLGAWIEGDGWSDKKGVHISTCNQRLALQCRDLLMSAGIPSSIYKIDHASCSTSGHAGSGDEYTVNISWIDAVQLAKWSTKVLESDYFVPDAVAESRKMPSCMRQCPDGTRAYRVSGIEDRDVVDLVTYNVEVEDDESYTLAGLISHNCKVPNDECTICGNEAPSTDKYCDHLTKYATQMLDDGRHVGMLNHKPTFFDISEVSRNADRIALSMRKVASHGAVQFSADLATEMGVTAPDILDSLSTYQYKQALRKLASFEHAMAKAVSRPEMRKIADVLKQPVGAEGVNDRYFRSALGILKRSNVCLCMEDFFKMAMGDRYNEVEHLIPSAMTHMPGMYREAEKNAEAFISGISAYEPLDIAIPNRVQRSLSKVANEAALNDETVNGRLTTRILTKSSSVVPYNSAPSNDPAGRKLAEEYARYKLAAVKGADNFVLKMSILQNM